MVCQRLPPKQDEGFSLVEVLVTLSLLAIISGLILLVTSQFRVLQIKQEEIIAEQELIAVARHIAQSLESAERLPLGGAQNGENIYLEGREDSIRFVAVVRVGANSVGLRDVSFSLRESTAISDGFELVETRRFRRDEAANDELQTEFVLATDVNNLQFRYKSEENDIEWTNRWSLPSRLPGKIAVRVRKLFGNRSIEGELFVTFPTVKIEF